MTAKSKSAAAALQDTVHTSALTTKAKPLHHQTTKLPSPDEFHGQAGRFVRDPLTGKRSPVLDPETTSQPD